MPIVISRTTDAPPVITNPLTPEQKNALWEAVVRSWVQRNPDTFAALVQGEPEEEGENHGAA